MKPKEYIQKALIEALRKSGLYFEEFNLPNLELAKQAEFGDLSSTLALNLTREAKKPPRQIAQQLVDNLSLDGSYVEKVEIAGAGFINFYLAKECLQQSVKDILSEGEAYGQSDWGVGKRIQFEFISANPTGPLNVVSARAAAVGDILANLYSAVGFNVEREYYVNDAGRQIRLLGASVSSRYMELLGKEEPFPEEGYHGDYIRTLAQEIITSEGNRFTEMEKSERHAALAKMACERIIEHQQNSLKRYNLVFDRWFHESEIRTEGEDDKLLSLLAEKKLSYEKDGAIWFKSSQFGDEKDRVLVTSEGEPTYFLIDIAYHQNKYARGFDFVHDLWGPDHHGYVDRMKAVMAALGHPADSFQVSIIQQVNLLRGGKVIKMSKRAGEIIEMDELIDEVGVDVSRFFFVDRRISTPLDFDIDLAKKESDENPVYYVQYAHARICSILRFATEQGVVIPDTADMSVLDADEEMGVIKKLLEFPEVVSKAAKFLEPHRLTLYLRDVATVFHRFYHNHRVVTDDHKLTAARLILTKATKLVLANGFKLLGISAPERM